MTDYVRRLELEKHAERLRGAIVMDDAKLRRVLLDIIEALLRHEQELAWKVGGSCDR